MSDPIAVLQELEARWHRQYRRALLFSIFFLARLQAAWADEQHEGGLAPARIVARNLVNQGPVAGDFLAELHGASPGLSRAESAQEIQGYVDFAALFWTASQGDALRGGALTLEGLLDGWPEFSRLPDAMKMHTVQCMVAIAERLPKSDKRVSARSLAARVQRVLVAISTDATYRHGVDVAVDTLLLYTDVLQRVRIDARTSRPRDEDAW